MDPQIRVGIGGWTYEPWRGAFFPEGLPRNRELEYASRKLNSIEINGTYYRTQTRESFARWHDQTPDDFVFSVKGSRYTTNQRVLAEAGKSIDHFFASGIVALKDKLGPVNWQFMPTKTFDPVDFEAFLKLLPATVEGRPIRHAVEVRHDSFRIPEFVDMARHYGVAIVVADRDPRIADATAPFVYARLQQANESIDSGYPPEELDAWADRAQKWAEGGIPQGLATVGAAQSEPPQPRNVFIYLINGFKPKAPAAAMALLDRLGAR
jgi:uncharacterized protein YecE (DUF72 family)